MPFEQLVWSQSVFATQCWLTAQRTQPLLVPPQSTSVSSWFSRPSEHDCERHLPPVHNARSQSLTLLQLLPFAHGSHVPPQSTSDSVWFLTPSLQLGAWHTPAVQAPPSQSESDVHALPGAQGAQPVEPPQSTSLSSWSLTLSPQVCGARQTLLAQDALAQSESETHDLPEAHGAQPVKPPQSTSLSS